LACTSVQQAEGLLLLGLVHRMQCELQLLDAHVHGLVMSLQREMQVALEPWHVCAVEDPRPCGSLHFGCSRSKILHITGDAHLRTPETCPTGEAHSSVVSTTPMSGSTRVNFLTALGNSSFSVTPAMVGTSTTWNVDSASPCAFQSTGRPELLAPSLLRPTQRSCG
jgi:hypothetical protein